MLICVTQQDIEKGGHKPDNCPVARALQRATGDKSATVIPARVWTKDFTVALPWSVGCLIGEYDMTGKMEPFCFELNNA